MSNIPRRVAADAAQADASLAELAASLQTAPPTQNIELPPIEPPAPAPAPAPAPPAPAPTVVPVDITAQLAQMRQELATAAGRAEAERLRNADLQAEIERLRAAPPTPPTPPAPPPQLITAQDRESFGEETIDFVERAIRHHTSSIASALQDIGNRLAGLEGRVGQTATAVASVQNETIHQKTKKYFDRLDAAVPTWEALQSDTKFLDWLDKREVLSGAKYGDLLADAHKRADAERVIELFRVYNPEVVTGSPATPAPSGQQTAQPLIDPTSLAAPQTSPAAPAPTQAATGEIWTSAQVDKMYEDKRRGKISDTDFTALEKRYMQALREGRVQA